jgi:fatty acid desaturase
MQELLQRRNSPALLHFATSIALAFASPLLFWLYPSIPMGIACVLLNLHTFNRFAQLVHGSDHSALFSDPRWSVRLGMVAGYFLGYTRDGHKAAHNEHHLYLNTEKDADRVWCEPDAKASTIFHGWVRDLFFASAAKRFLQYASVRSNSGKAQSATTAQSLRDVLGMLPAAAVQGMLLLAYGIGAGFQYYFLLYLLPLATLYPALIRLRSHVEHAYEPGYEPKSALARKVTRSAKANWLERFVMAPLYIEYHYEHHILPNMPYYNAPKMRRLLSEKGIAIPFVNGYFAFVWRKWRIEKAASAGAAL